LFTLGFLLFLAAGEVAAWLLAPDRSLFLTYLKKQTSNEGSRAFLHAVLKPTIAALATGVGGRQEVSHVQLANITLDFLRQLSYNTGVCPLKIREAFVLLHRALSKRHKVVRILSFFGDEAHCRMTLRQDSIVRLLQGLNRFLVHADFESDLLYCFRTLCCVSGARGPDNCRLQ
jgi:hypothetical protein